MSSFIVLVAIATCCISLVCGDVDSPNLRPMLGSYVESCSKPTGASPDDAEIILTVKKLSTNTQNCLIYCVYNGIAVQNGLKFASLEHLVAAYSQAHAGNTYLTDNAQANVKECLAAANASEGMKNKDPCAVAGTMQNCFAGQSHSH